MEEDNLILIKLHENKQYLDECCDLINSHWSKKSRTVILHSLNQSNDNYPCNFILIDSKNSKLIGHACIDLVPKNDTKQKTAFIKSVIIDNQYRKTGLGRNLMNKLEQILKKDQFEIVSLTTSFKVKFYESIGYELKNHDLNRSNDSIESPLEINQDNDPVYYLEKSIV